MVGQAQVVVAGQVDHLLAVVVAHRRLLVVQNAQVEVRALGAQFVQRGGQVGKLGAGSGLGHGDSPQRKSIATGIVTISDNGTHPGRRRAQRKGKATLAMLDLPAGDHSLTAVYNGDATHLARL
jgi:hypothetical protein